MFVTRSFLSQLPAPSSTTDTSSKSSASVIFLSSGAALIALPGGSAYSLSKLADLRLASFVAVERPDVHSVAIHPGIVPTDMATDFFKPYAVDTPELAGGVVNWATNAESGFLAGRYISVNVSFPFTSYLPSRASCCYT
jgi:NAD(P)-dependent dehydrogenase (short-subunit alcohol dehydrogenase family)